MRRGWFEIPGVQRGDRTLDQQLSGLEIALQEAKGKKVVDLGCAEGLIAKEFAKVAKQVLGMECNHESVAEATKQLVGFPARVRQGNLNDGLPDWPCDIVLALAILHKLKDPAATVAGIANWNPRLVVVRLPGGSEGYFETKTYGTQCDLNAEFRANGFRLDSTAKGPFNEVVQYWRV